MLRFSTAAGAVLSRRSSVGFFSQFSSASQSQPQYFFPSVKPEEKADSLIFAFHSHVEHLDFKLSMHVEKTPENVLEREDGSFLLGSAARVTLSSSRFNQTLLLSHFLAPSALWTFDRKDGLLVDLRHQKVREQLDFDDLDRYEPLFQTQLSIFPLKKALPPLFERYDPKLASSMMHLNGSEPIFPREVPGYSR